MASVFFSDGGKEKKKLLMGRYYTSEFRQMNEAIKLKRRGKLTTGVLMLQDNLSVHTAQVAEKLVSLCNNE